MNPLRFKFPRAPRNAIDPQSAREVHAAVVAILKTTGVNCTVTFSDSNGMIVVPKAGNASKPKMGKVTALHGDYLEVREYVPTAANAGAVTGDVVKVAKHPMHRTSRLSETIDGVPVNFVYTGSNERTATDAGGVDTEKMHPRYVLGVDANGDAIQDGWTGVIFYQEVEHTAVFVDDAELTFMELDWRAWAKPENA